MKIVTTPTQWILVTVPTSGSQAIDYILLQMTPSYRQFLRATLDATKAVSHLSGFYRLNCWDIPDGWFLYYHEGIEHHIKTKGLCWSFIEFDIKGEREELRETDVSMEIQYISVFSSGNAQWHGTAKYEDDEQWTEEIPLPEILDQLDQAFGKV